MKAAVIRSYIDKYSNKSISVGTEIEVDEERFGELTSGPKGIFVKEVPEEVLEEAPEEEKVENHKAAAKKESKK